MRIRARCALPSGIRRAASDHATWPSGMQTRLLRGYGHVARSLKSLKRRMPDRAWTDVTGPARMLPTSRSWTDVAQVLHRKMWLRSWTDVAQVLDRCGSGPGQMWLRSWTERCGSGPGQMRLRSWTDAAQVLHRCGSGPSWLAVAPRRFVLSSGGNRYPFRALLQTLLPLRIRRRGTQDGSFLPETRREACAASHSGRGQPETRMLIGHPAAGGPGRGRIFCLAAAAGEMPGPAARGPSETRALAVTVTAARLGFDPAG